MMEEFYEPNVTSYKVPILHALISQDTNIVDFSEHKDKLEDLSKSGEVNLLFWIHFDTMELDELSTTSLF